MGDDRVKKKVKIDRLPGKLYVKTIRSPSNHQKRGLASKIVNLDGDNFKEALVWVDVSYGRGPSLTSDVINGKDQLKSEVAQLFTSQLLRQAALTPEKRQQIVVAFPSALDHEVAQATVKRSTLG